MFASTLGRGSRPRIAAACASSPAKRPGQSYRLLFAVIAALARQYRKLTSRKDSPASPRPIGPGNPTGLGENHDFVLGHSGVQAGQAYQSHGDVCPLSVFFSGRTVFAFFFLAARL